MLGAFRRMVFNVLAHNRDDHVKNFAFILDDSTGGWALSPAYDLLWTAGPGGEHTMTLAGEGRNPTREHVLKLAAEAGIAAKRAAAVTDEVSSAVARWRHFANKAGVQRDTSRRIAEGVLQVEVTAHDCGIHASNAFGALETPVLAREFFANAARTGRSTSEWRFPITPVLAREFLRPLRGPFGVKRHPWPRHRPLGAIDSGWPTGKNPKRRAGGS